MKALLFDFWGTLVENGVWSPTKQVKNLLQIDLPFSEYVLRMERALMTKPFPSLREAFQELCKEFSLDGTAEQLDQLIGLWNKNWMLARPFADVKDTLQDLQQRYTLVLISNTDCFSVRSILEKYNLLELFDVVKSTC